MKTTTTKQNNNNNKQTTVTRNGTYISGRFFLVHVIHVFGNGPSCIPVRAIWLGKLATKF